MASVEAAVMRTREALEANPEAHWIIGFSGGKDSTAVLKIFVAAARDANPSPAKIDLIYCDTGVENPVLDHYVQSLLGRLHDEFAQLGAPFRTNLLKAPVGDRFFVKIIGRGYPPPTNAFRWCTKNLRIKPVSRFIQAAAAGDAVVALGMRQAESQQRDRTLRRGGGEIWQDQIEGGRKYRLFLPIIDLDVYEVWDAIFTLPLPRSIEPAVLSKLYKDASGECPLIKAPEAAPCASGRFGCWTCTVVRKDRSSRTLIEAGYIELQPYLEFRDWLADIRNDPTRRWPKRRSGVISPGPFSLAARGEILRRLEDLERDLGVVVLPQDERSEIDKLWAMDRDADVEYAEYR